MKQSQVAEAKDSLVLDYELDASLQKVWRAISIPEFRECWLPNEALSDPEAISSTPEREIRYRMRDRDPPFLESTVTFQVSPNPTGGTNLRVIHELSDARLDRMMAANDNGPPLALAA